MDSASIIRKVVAAGWVLTRVKGSHHHFKHATRVGIVTVPHPRRDVPMGTRKSIERQSGVRL